MGIKKIDIEVNNTMENTHEQSHHYRNLCKSEEEERDKEEEQA